MGFFGDLSFLLVSSVTTLAVRQPHTLELSLITGLALGVLCWWGCTYFARLWNTRWQLKLVHHLLCAFAGLVTFGAALLFVSLSYAEDAALASIQIWQVQINRDSTWQSEVFAKAYDTLKALGTEDFTNYPSPASGGSVIPVNSKESRYRVAEIYADAACKHFSVHRPFLSRMVWPPNSSVPRNIILTDVNDWFERKHENYMGNQAVSLAATQIRNSLELQAPRVIYMSRIIVVGAFLVAQAVPFGLIGYAAYRDLKVMT